MLNTIRTRKEAPPTDPQRGRRILEAMRKLDLNDTQLASIMRVTKNAVGNWKKGQTIRANHLVPLARALRMTVDELLTGNRHNLDLKDRALLLRYHSLKPCQQAEEDARMNRIAEDNRDTVEYFAQHPLPPKSTER